MDIYSKLLPNRFILSSSLIETNFLRQAPLSIHLNIFLRHLNELRVLNNVKVNILINRHSLKLSTVITELSQLLNLLSREVWAKVTLVLLKNDWLSLLASETVAEWRLNDDLLENGSVLESTCEGVGDGTLAWVVIVGGKLLILHALNLLSQALNQWGGSSLSTISIIRSLQTSINKHDRSHVLNAVIAIREVIHRLELLIDYTDTSLVGTTSDMLDILSSLAHRNQLLADSCSCLNRSLRVELRWIGDLEEHVLHDVGAVLALELERLALEEDVIETPDRSTQDSWNTRLTSRDLQGKVNGALASVACGPGLARHGVGGVAVRAEGLAIDPSLRDSITGLSLGQAEKLGDNGGGCDFDEDNVVETNLVVGVKESQASLNLVRLDHSLKHLLDGNNLTVSELASGAVGAGDPVCNGKDGAQVVGWVTPLSSQPTIIVVEPSDHGADVEGGVDWVELEVGSWNLWSVWNNGAWDDWAEELGALFEAETLETAAEGVEEDESGGVEL